MHPAPHPEIIAHRGFSARAPENTLAALEAALSAGTDAVELDLQTAACGTPVVFHDEMLGRTTNGVGPVRRRSVAQLKALDAGSWFSESFAHETIPTQEEALVRLREGVGRVYQHVKGYREMEDLDRMATITRENGLADVTVFVSGDWVVQNRLRQTAPEIRRAYLVEESRAFPEALDRAVVDDGAILNVEMELASKHPDVVAEALGAGVEVAVWTVDDAEAAARAVELGCTRIITNEVGRLLAWREGLSR
jgi:glycerophosphoryl diester phosphodiesterase